MEVLLEVVRFDMDGGVELTMIHTYIDVQKCDFGEGVPGELDGIAAVEAFKELGEGIGTIRPKEENVINKYINLAEQIFNDIKYNKYLYIYKSQWVDGIQNDKTLCIKRLKCIP